MSVRNFDDLEDTVDAILDKASYIRIYRNENGSYVVSARDEVGNTIAAAPHDTLPEAFDRCGRRVRDAFA